MRDDLLRMAFTTSWLLACAPADQARQRCAADATAPCTTPNRPNVAGPAGERAGTSGIGGLVAGQGSFTGHASGHTAVVGASDGDLSVHVEDDKKLKLTVIRLACAGSCADIEAVASGGNPPYSFAWEDGSRNAKRRVCLDVSKSLRITVTDTAIDAAEFGHTATMASAELMAIVSACSSDAGAPPPTTCTQEAGPVSCLLPSGATLPEDITVKLIDEAQYFAGGIDLPAGRYRLAYVDGCFSYGQPITTYGWTVHALKAAGFGCWLIDGNGMALMPTPGTDGITLESGAFETYAKCVAANCSQAPLDFDFAGGKLGVARNGGTAFAEFDDMDGSDMGGRGPTFRLSRLDPCP